VKAWPAVSYRRVAQGFKDLHLAIMEDRITHDGNAALNRHIGNAVRREVQARDAEGHKLWIASKDSPDSSHKIDAFYAAMLAHTAASDAVMKGYRPRRSQLVSF
jgi:phage terminase large subunit-like protein